MGGACWPARDRPVSQRLRFRLSALLLAVTLAVVATSACSPEATRQRNGGPGADVGNHSRNIPEPSQAPSTHRG
jgi:hypothetical protein